MALFFDALKQLSNTIVTTRLGKAALGIRDDSIGDMRLFEQLSQVRRLKTFLFQQNVTFKESDLTKIHLDRLDALVFHVYGRAPTPQEWSLLDEKLIVVSGFFEIPILRWKKRLTELGAYFRNLPIFF